MSEVRRYFTYMQEKLEPQAEGTAVAREELENTGFGSTVVRRRKVSPLGLVISVICCGLAALFMYFFPRPAEILNCRLYDWKMSLHSRPGPPFQIVHLDVDDQATREFGAWPWDRSVSARILDRLSDLGARVIVFDVMYSARGPSENGDQAFFDSLKRSGNVVTATGLGATGTAGQEIRVEVDTRQAEALFEKTWPVQVPPGFDLYKVTCLKSAFVPRTWVILNSTEIGHIKASPDTDGVYRKIPLLVQLGDRYVPSLSLAALKVFWNLTSESIRLDASGELHVVHGGETVRIPVNSRGMMHINWGDVWETVPQYSVLDVLGEEADPDCASRYKDKIVIIGVVATGTTDFGVTPVALHSPLSRIHSHALNTIFTGNFITSVPPFPYPVIAGTLLALLFAVAALRMRLRTGIVLALSVGGMVFLFSFLVFLVWAYDIPVAEVLMIFIPTLVASLVSRTVLTELQALRASRALEKYLSPELLENIVERGMAVDLSSKRRELTVLFVDIEGFSTISENAEAEHVNLFLNDFFDRMTSAVFRHHGTIDKFLGDGLLAFFGDPVPLENHALAALRASLEMQDQMEAMNQLWASSGRCGLDQGIHIRIGLNSGLVIVGNIGSSRRLEYTVLGSVVNIAGRLQSVAPPGGIVMTGTTWDLARDHLAVECQGPEMIRARGIGKDIEVYTISPIAIAARRTGIRS